MLSSLRVCFALAVLTLFFAPRPGAAQPSLPPEPALKPPVRLSDALYLKPRLGFAAYGGDRSSLGASLSTPGPATGLEVGYRRPLFLFNGGVGAYLLLGRYPSITAQKAGAPEVATGELNRWRHTLGLTGYIELAPRARVTPYLQLGAGATAGVVDDRFRVAFSPLAGVGFDFALTDQVGLFAEATAIFSLSDERLDRAEALGGGAADWLGFFGGGVRIGLDDPFARVDVLAIDGPTWLRVGEPAAFEPVTRSGATEPVEYLWDFGDGGTATGAQVAHRFTEPGNYTLSVTATNGGPADVQLLSVTVAPSEPILAEVLPLPSPAPVPSPAVEAPEERLACAEIVEMNGITFEHNSAILSAESREALLENVEVMQRCPALTVRLAGSAAPGEQRAAMLQHQRAAAVQQFYARRSIAGERLLGIQTTPAPDRLSRKEGLARLRRVDTLPSSQQVAGRE